MNSHPAPAGSTEIRVSAEDATFPNMIMGWTAQVDGPNGPRGWVAMYPDYDGDAELVVEWSETLPSAELADAYVRTRYAKWLREHEQWVAGALAANAAWNSPTWPN